MNIQVLDTRLEASGGYKVDVTRGERIGRVSSEWFARPADERYLSLSTLYDHVHRRTERSRTRVVESALIHVEANRNDPERLSLVLPGVDTPVTPTHWSFGQLASLVGAPATYLRQLPAPLAAINLQYGLTSIFDFVQGITAGIMSERQYVGIPSDIPRSQTATPR
jgi:hypothetical protein